MRRTCGKSGGIFFFLETLRTKEVDAFGEMGIKKFCSSELVSELYLENSAPVMDFQKN